MDILQVLLTIIGMGSAVLIFLLNRQKARTDRLESRLDGRVDNLQTELKAHEVSDAANLITRVETDIKIEALKKDIRGIISPLSDSIKRIEDYLLKPPKN